MKVRAFIMPDDDDGTDFSTKEGRAKVNAAVQAAALAHQGKNPQGGSTVFRGTPRLAKHDQVVEHGGRQVRVV